MIKIEILTETDIEQVNALYYKEYQRHRSESQFRWEFFDGPAGPAVYVIARDTETNLIIGTVCAIPFLFQNDFGEKFLTGKVEDLLIQADYRGKKVFEQMYVFLEHHALERGVSILWAFTYANKSFLRLGFLSPFTSNLGFKFFKWLPSIKYLQARKKKTSRNLINTVGIVSLSRIIAIGEIFQRVSLNTYCMSEEKSGSLVSLLNQNSGKNISCYSILQDNDFLNWRIYQNPYVGFVEHILKSHDGELAGSIIYSVSDNVANLIQQMVHSTVPDEVKRGFIKMSVQQISKVNHFVKFWGFTHNQISIAEIELMKSAGLLFIGRGIPFVWKNISAKNYAPNEILLSRMASQGTI